MQEADVIDLDEDENGPDILAMLEAGIDASVVSRRKIALTFAMSFYTNGDHDTTAKNPSEVARCAETFDRFLRGDGVANIESFTGGAQCSS